MNLFDSTRRRVVPRRGNRRASGAPRGTRSLHGNPSASGIGRGGGAEPRERGAAVWWRASPQLLVWLALGVACARGDDATEQPSLLERDQLSGDWGGSREDLKAYGIVPYLLYTGSMWSNVDGGIRTGTEFDGYLDFGFGLDLGTLGLWDGLKLQASWHWFQGRSPSTELVGVNLSQAVNPWEASNAFRFFNLYLSQSFGDQAELRIGQMAVDSDFMVSRYAATMLNAAFGDLPSQNLNLDVPVYPIAGPGIYATGPLGSALIGRLGFYTADTPPDTAGNHGLEWKLGNNAGYAAFAELSLNASPAALPGAYTLGGYFASVRQPALDGRGTVHAQWMGWVMVDQALRVDEQGNPQVGVFARFSYAPNDERDVAEYYGDAGLNVFGAVPGRPKDVLGFAGTVLRFTDDFLANPPASTTLQAGGEAVLELSYQINATPWLVVQPDLQYVIDPVAADENATVIGLEMVLTF